jgi:hypothetical protein
VLFLASVVSGCQRKSSDITDHGMFWSIIRAKRFFYAILGEMSKCASGAAMDPPMDPAPCVAASSTPREIPSPRRLWPAGENAPVFLLEDDRLQ